jgi:MEDS: MEthanogen/methylotroph, DcmR Sensory domain
VNHPNNEHHNHVDIPNEIVLRLLKLPPGYHYLILYPNIETIRKIYGEYLRAMIEENNAAVLFLPFYDTTDKVRQQLLLKGIDVRKYERGNTLTLIDFAKIIDNPYLGIPASFGVKEFIDKIRIFHKKKDLVVITDMSVYNHFRNIEDLLNYESLSRNGDGNGKWKQICLYHKVDFDLMFTPDQRQKIFDYHKDKVALL